MAGELLGNISPDKIEYRDAEYYKQGLDLSPGYTGDSCNIANMDIQRNIGMPRTYSPAVERLGLHPCFFSCSLGDRNAEYLFKIGNQAP